MPVGQPTRTTPMYSSTIVTSDPTTGTIEAIIAGNLENVSVITTSVAFRWPVAGETWRIKNINGIWYLDEPYPVYNPGSTAATSTTAATTISTVQPGDAVINSPTGRVWVLGSPTGASDFSFVAPIYGRVTLIAGVKTVLIPTLTPTNTIFLTAQDSNSTGALRVDTRIPSTSFTIKSSNLADHGVVGYQILP